MPKFFDSCLNFGMTLIVLLVVDHGRDTARKIIQRSKCAVFAFLLQVMKSNSGSGTHSTTNNLLTLVSM